jgi:hypothetical protein
MVEGICSPILTFSLIFVLSIIQWFILFSLGDTRN